MYTAGFVSSIKNGQILCEFINIIKPGSVRKIETSKLVSRYMHIDRYIDKKVYT